MSLTKVTYSMISGATYNVLDYGAVGDGATDATAAIQLAVAAANASGGTVFFPAGTYLVGAIASVSIITMSDNTVVLGEGAGNTVIFLADTSNKNIISAVDKENVSVKNLTINCNGANQTTGNGIVFEGVVNFYIDSVELLNARNNGILFQYGTRRSQDGILSNSVIDKTYVNHCIALSGDPGTGVVSGAKNVVISNNIVKNPTQSAVNLSQASECVVSANTIAGDGVTDTGFGGVRFTNGSSYNTATANTISSMSRGVFVAEDAGVGDGPCEHNIISSNNIQLCLRQGVLAQGNWTQITNNSVVDCASLAASSSKFGVNIANASYCSIVGNAVFDSDSTHHDYAIRISGTSNYCLVSSNTIDGWALLPTSIVGANTKVNNNPTDLSVDRPSTGTITIRDVNDFVNVTGTTTTNFISSTPSDDRIGRTIVLQFNDNITIKNNQTPIAPAKAILLAGGVDFSATAGDTLTLIYNGAAYVETARSVN
jgi:hypothetical protein